MRYLIPIVLLLFVGVSGAVTSGAISIDDGTATVEQVEDGEVLVENDTLVWTPDSDWDRTLQQPGSDQITIELEDAQTGDTGTWQDTGISARRTVPDTTPVVRVQNHTTNLTTVQILNREFVEFSGDEISDVTIGTGVSQIDLTEYGVGDPISWRGNGSITVDGFETGQAYRIVDGSGRVVGIDESLNGQVSIPGDGGQNVRIVEEGTTTQANDVVIDPVFESWRIDSGIDPVPTDITLNNTANETRNISVGSSPDWIETSGEISVLDNVSTETTIFLNSSAAELGTQTGEIQWTVGNETTSTYIELEVTTSVPSGPTSISIPTWIVLLVSGIIVLSTTVLWVLIDPQDDDNLWV